MYKAIWFLGMLLLFFSCKELRKRDTSYQFYTLHATPNSAVALSLGVNVDSSYGDGAIANLL
ncbi:hypothetical protein D1627_10940 [Pontibacter oryzae]|uniref:Uncharacterized protein n=1 Tax=Pontibacter oryzae TaxID=2304593 RepID=A0A399S4G2_9BACT|nr:hypothetical protein D1627_10940 [Pontibacter oryzae]